jgi:hypothetical protein
MASATDYQRALDAALRELEQALADRAALETRIAQLHETVGTLTRLCGFTPTVPFGLTDACRMALRCAAGPMTAIEMRNRLDATGFDLTRYANALAAIHTVLKRLVDAGEASAVDADESSRLAYAFREADSSNAKTRRGDRRPRTAVRTAASRRTRR